MQPAPLMLSDAFKQYRHDQEKMLPPEETVARFKHRVAQTGLDILKDVIRVDNGRLGIPVYFSLCGADAQAATGNVKQMGKGATPAQAQASAVMELAERFSLFSFLQNPQNFVYAPANSLEQPTIDFQWLTRSMCDTPDELPILHTLFKELPLQWTWAHNLTRRETVLVPFNWFWAINEFNGACAGNGIEEALSQGISEVVERHVSALICRRREEAPLIDVQSIADPVAVELIGKFRTAGIELYLSDFSCDMGIPTIGALAWDPTTFPGKSEIVWTAGTTPNPAKALCRALTEVAQLAGDFNSGANYVASGLPKFRRIEDADFVTRPGRSIKIDALPDLGDPNIKIELERCIGALAKRGNELFAVDVHHTDLSIPAFYVILPGAQFRERATQASAAMIYAKLVTENSSQDQAIDRLMQFDRRLPRKYFTQFYLGRLYLEREGFAEAEQCLRLATDLEPPAEDLATIYTYLGVCHKEQARYPEALDALGQAARIDPERTDTLNLMGFCYFKLKAHPEAIACFEKVVGLNPGSAIDYANLAVNYRALNEREKAIEYYQLALALDPGIGFARDHLTQMGVPVG
jgi:ribosomal protein S12 methylthiotransferase accessory factor